MDDPPDITVLTSAMGEPARARMLTALMDGRALTATELAVEAGVTPSTASSHLAKLRRVGLIALAAQGRHRYFRIATSAIASVLESLMGLAAEQVRPRTAPRDPALRHARVCYDHLAGERGVALLERMRERHFLRGDGGSLEVTPAGEAWLRELGIDVAELARRPRPLVRSCLDWSERRDHLAGAVGAAILTRLLELRLVRRDPLGRAVTIATRGETFLSSLEIPRR
jgi:DNA-binding transcriptional ArsR family regulator